MDGSTGHGPHGFGMNGAEALGPLVAAGWLASTLVAAGAGAATGGIIGAFTGAGISEDDAQRNHPTANLNPFQQCPEVTGQVFRIAARLGQAQFLDTVAAIFEAETQSQPASPSLIYP